MPFEITEAYQKQVADVFQSVFQQSDSKLADTVRRDTQQGIKKAYDYIAPTSGIRNRARKSTTAHVNPEHTRRWVSTVPWTWPVLIDDLDVLETIKNPQSEYLRSARMSYGRALDEEILYGLGATAYIGAEGNTALPYYEDIRVMHGDGVLATAGSAEAASTETGLTLAKIATIGALMDDNDVPDQGRVIVCNSNNRWALLDTVEVGSAEYNPTRDLVRGVMNEFMGYTFKWLPTARFADSTTDPQTSTAGCIDAFAYQRDAVLLATSKELETTVDRMPGYNNATQLWMEAKYGVTRLQGAGVVKIITHWKPTLTYS